MPRTIRDGIAEEINIEKFGNFQQTPRVPRSSMTQVVACDTAEPLRRPPRNAGTLSDEEIPATRVFLTNKTRNVLFWTAAVPFQTPQDRFVVNE